MNTALTYKNSVIAQKHRFLNQLTDRKKCKCDSCRQYEYEVQARAAKVQAVVQAHKAWASTSGSNPGWYSSTATTTITNLGSTYNYTLVPDDAYEVASWPAECIDLVLTVDKDGAAIIQRHAQIYKMPDGSFIHVDSNGNFTIEDKNAKVTYRANRLREFNRFLNASDLMAKFIGELAPLGIRQGEVGTLPLGLFVNWLVIAAAEADKDPIPEGVGPLRQNPLLVARVKPRCPVDGRFLPRHSTFPFCNPRCATVAYERRIPCLERQPDSLLVGSSASPSQRSSGVPIQPGPASPKDYLPSFSRRIKAQGAAVMAAAVVLGQQA